MTTLSIMKKAQNISRVPDVDAIAEFIMHNTEAILSDLTHEMVSVNIRFLIFGDLSVPNVPKFEKLIIFARLTAAKRMITTRWKPPHSLATQLWVLSFLDVIYMELLTAQINSANESTLKTWRSAAESLKKIM